MATYRPSERRVFQSTLPARGATRPTLDAGRNKAFQSTLPARGATAQTKTATCWTPYFNPRSPRGERHMYVHEIVGSDGFQSTLPARGATGCDLFPGLSLGISIHAPREGSDRSKPSTASYAVLFQSTLPARGATQSVYDTVTGMGISIHAPREGSDDIFNVNMDTLLGFQSTLPARGATVKPGSIPSELTPISIHAPREGSDSSWEGKQGS